MAFEEGVFEVGSIFRSEGQSSRHLCEFVGIDIEVPWLTLQEVMKLEEEMLCHSFKKLEPFKEDVKRIFGVELVTEPSIKYMTLDEAKEILKLHGTYLTKDQDLPDECEKKLILQ